jgi:hypothetical protein
MQTPSQGHSSPLGLSAWHAARRGVGRDYSVARAWTGAVDGRGPSESAAYGEGKLGALRRSWQRWGRDWRGDRYGAGTDTARGQIRRGDRYGGKVGGQYGRRSVEGDQANGLGTDAAGTDTAV